MIRATILCLLSVSALGCSLGEGEGEVKSDRLLARDCWDDVYDLEPDFFAADPFREKVHFRIQRGGNVQEVSDGLSVLVDDVKNVRENMLGQEIAVTLPPGVAPPGVAVGEQCGGEACETSPVHVALFLHESCHNQNVVLYGLSGTIVFDSLYSGDKEEKDAAEKLTEARFDIMVGDPRDGEVTEGGGLGEIPNQSHVTGYFEFFFERGQPAQPFP